MAISPASVPDERTAGVRPGGARRNHGMPLLGAAFIGLLLVALLGGQSSAQLPAGNRSRLTTAATAASARPTVALVGSTVDGQVFTGARLWDEHVNWCDLQPTAQSDLAGNIRTLLGPKLDRLVAAGARTVVLPLGHPAPWVFGDDPRAWALNARWSGGLRPVWFCAGRASGVSIPSPVALRAAADGTPSVQQRRFTEYVRAIVSFIAERYHGTLSVDLQVWNEPNLLNGIDTAARIPGAARTTSEVVASLRAYERIVAAEIATAPVGGLRLVSPSFYQRINTMLRTYLAAENRQPLVSALAFNVYSRRKTPDAMVSDWDRRANNLAILVSRYPNLRNLPRLVTETNHNLNNHTPSDRSNAAPIVTAPATQKRLATATELNAMYRRFLTVYWLLPASNQAAVAVSLAPANPARTALGSLVGALGERILTGCAYRSGTRFCYFRDPSGVLPPARAIWRLSGTRWLTVPPSTSVTDLGTGKVRITVGEAIRITTTPVITWDATASVG